MNLAGCCKPMGKEAPNSSGASAEAGRDLKWPSSGESALALYGQQLQIDISGLNKNRQPHSAITQSQRDMVGQGCGESKVLSCSCLCYPNWIGQVHLGERQTEFS